MSDLVAKLSESLRTSERNAHLRSAELAAVLDATPLAIALLDRDLRFRRVNARFAAFDGVAPLEHASRAIADVAPRLERSLAPIARRVLATGAQAEADVEAGADGKRALASLSPVVDADGAIDGLLLVLGERARTAAIETELARAKAELAQFAYLASHDLQEPLRMVKSYTELVARRYRDRLDEAADEFLRFACDGATRMQSLLDDLLAYSRAGRGGGEPIETSASAAVAVAIDRLRASIDENRATIEVGDLPDVRAEPAELAQLFERLIDNAIKFRRESPPRVTISAARGAGEWTFAIADQGIGIPKEQAGRLFAAFQRLHPRDRYPGNGIGLAIAKKIVERHGGRIWLESRASEGSTFSFALPDRATLSAE